MKRLTQPHAWSRNSKPAGSSTTPTSQTGTLPPISCGAARSVRLSMATRSFTPFMFV